MNPLQKVIVIVGPTCSGKTALSLLLAEKLNIEIISADSRQVYKYLTIGTAKPNKEDFRNTKHYFIDELNPDEEFNADHFANRAKVIIKNIFKSGKIPLVVGGSGLYVKALIDGIIVPVRADKSLREELLRLRKEFGNDYLYEELKKIDPVSAEKMLPQNWKRIIRAIEVYKLSGKHIWQFHSKKPEEQFKFLQYGLRWDRKILYAFIENRIDEMIKKGLLDEVIDILNMGYSKELNSLNTVGYKELIGFIENNYSFEEAVQLIKRNTRRYAKRQLTWFNADKRIKWFNVESHSEFEKIADEIIKDFYER